MDETHARFRWSVRDRVGSMTMGPRERGTSPSRDPCGGVGVVRSICRRGGARATHTHARAKQIPSTSSSSLDRIHVPAARSLPTRKTGRRRRVNNSACARACVCSQCNNNNIIIARVRVRASSIVHRVLSAAGLRDCARLHRCSDRERRIRK